MATTKTTQKRKSEALKLAHKLRNRIKTIKNDPDTGNRSELAWCAMDQCDVLIDEIKKINKKY